eukprot:759633-Pyramimonas_sp.AAC.1
MNAAGVPPGAAAHLLPAQRVEELLRQRRWWDPDLQLHAAAPSHGVPQLRPRAEVEVASAVQHP